ncbi:MAG TPA: glycoside hydrolase family 43 protein [Candidatus Limnocylindrales bacterium]|nr:glycoside hydrolase family 43 protein [Candidatus Limnocylindrales bacterium]
MKRLALLLALILVPLPFVAAPASAANTAFVMAYFTESPSRVGSNYGLHLAVSNDGLTWSPLNQNNPVATPTQGTLGLRDPYILRRQDGTFVILATDLNGTDFSLRNQFIHVWFSTDMTSFTGYHRLRLNTLQSHTWAPEAFWDPARGQYGIIYSINNGTRDVFFVNYTTDFQTVSSPQVFFDPGFNVLDGTVFSDGGVNYLYYKNLANGLLFGARSNTLNPGSFTTYTSGMIQGNGIEAPIIAKALTSNTFYLWGDSYSPVNGEFYAWSTGSISGGSWTVMNQRNYAQPLNSKHASIAQITAAEYNAMVSRWGLPSWTRLKSYNYPDRYWRHSNFNARIDPYPFDPYQDQQWVMVPGLADSAGVSLRSANFPDRYLRQSNFALRIDPNDGTATFRGDATFYRVAGLADASMSSFRSFSQPTRYIRHFNFALRLDVLTSGSPALDRQDATFRVQN